MASSYKFNSTGTATYDGRYMRVTCTQKQDIAKNTSTINWKLEVLGGNSLYYYTGPTELKINGKVVYSCGAVQWTTQKFPAAKGSVSGSLTVSHNDDGSKKISVYLTTAIYVATTHQDGGIWTLDTIPRKATITSAPNFTDLDNPTIEYSNLAGSAVSRLDAYIGLLDGSGKEVLRTANRSGLSVTGSSYTFTLTDDERNALRNTATGKSMRALFALKTTLSGIEYWHTVEKTFSVVESDATRPSVSMSISPVTELNDQKFNGVFIQGKSKASVTLTASGKYNATIQSYATTIGGKTYTDASFTTDTLMASGNPTIIGTAVDSRGFTGSASQEITVHEYATPTITIKANTPENACYRSDVNGEPVGSSTSVWLKVKRKYSSIGGLNTCRLRYTVIPDNGTTPIEGTLLSSTDGDEYNRLITIKDSDGKDYELDPKVAYTIRVEAVDDVGEYARYTFYIPTEDVPLHLAAGGTMTSVGGYADTAYPHSFQSHWNAHFFNDAHFFKDVFIHKSFAITGQIHGTIANSDGVADVLAFAEGCENGVTPFTTCEESTNIPSNSFKYSNGVVRKRTSGQITVQIFGYQSGVIAINSYRGSSEGWTGWRLDDPIVESKINTSATGWSYEVYASGKAHCWGNFDMDITINQSWGTGFYYGDGVAVDYPFTFAQIPVCTYSRAHYRYLLIDVVRAEGNASKTPKVGLIRNATGESRTYRYSFDVWGIKA